MFYNPKTWVVILPTVTALLVLLSPASADQRANDLSDNLSKTTSVIDSDKTTENPDTDTAQDDQAPSWVGWIELSGSLRDSPPPFAWVGPEQAGASLASILHALGRVARDDDYAGVVIRLDDPRLTFSQIDEITQALTLIRDAGRKVLVFADQYDLRGYLLACGGDQILLQHKGQLELSGLAVEEVYLAGLLDKLGMKADFLQVGRFKGAAEPLTLTGPSNAWSQNIDGVLNDLYDQVIERITSGRGLTRQQVEQLWAKSWAMSDEDYVESGLVDHLAHRDLIGVTGEVFGDQFSWIDLLDQHGPHQNMDNPFTLFKLLFQDAKPKVRRPSIAIIHAQGPIGRGDGGGDSFGGQSIGSESMIDALNLAKDNHLIKAVLLRIDSPGGSALASELIWQAVREVGCVKPVYVSVGAMAASGGYYIACAGDRVYVSPDTIVGSIGVVGGKITLGGLYDKVGVTVHRRSRGPLGDMFNSVEPFTAEQRSTLLASVQLIYEQFIDRITIGRGQRIADIASVAQGRLFTGRQAVDNGLVDKIGGLETALADLAAKAGFEPDRYDVIHLPAPKSLPEFLEEMFSVSMTGPRLNLNLHTLVQGARAALGANAWRAVQPVVTGLMMLRHEPILVIIPAAIVIR